jgi:Fe-Mn family superoxide dismutase
MKKQFFLVFATVVLALVGVFAFKFAERPAPPFTLPPLPYAADALEPYFDKMTMEIHHDRHHKAYVDNLNKAIGETGDSKLGTMTLSDILATISKYPAAIRNNAGGHYNHSMFWTILDPDNTDKPTGEFETAMNKKFGSYDKFKEEFKKAATGRFGSGWAWLIVDSKGELKITSTPNQDNPLMDVVPAEERGFPVLGLDVWEHAYYLKYQNKRADFVDAFWNVVNWKEVESRYLKAKKK